MIDTAILLNAGKGTRLLPLTADRPKCLIEVGGRAIVDHQLDALAAAGVKRRIVVGGYRIDRLADHLAARGDDVELRFNPFWAVSSSISSVWAARDLLEGRYAILNGDTVYEPTLISDGLSRIQQGVNLFVEPMVSPVLDEMLVEMEAGLVRQVAKTLNPSRARFHSLGVIASVDDGGVYRAGLDKAMRAENGIQSFHHAIIDDLAKTGPVHGVVIDKGHWVEIDRVEHIAGWKG
ncbi:NTP transferase domain-containing protein [Sphingosinicella sp. LHD-64]|uniref:phosphocholine cytidylyltransferase family protein n=1 Tax=Sphingosinicella sp. LHD-64 TaxID=3072139 RepID=UPI00280DE960|nr:sugar phosphate nucleotidyltransferase [Sphingosinicella sp. LHD-64]MDQ8756378.1 NTP transferase domain-containing protein [Sphingosinicella sp. LHD-64]